MFKKFRQIGPIALSATIGFLLAALLFIPKAYSSNQNVYKVLREKINVLQQIISYVNHFYFDSVNMDKVLDGAFHGLMEELDPHSTYIPAKEQENINELFKGKFQGIGIEFDILDGFITVISPVPDSPSDFVGLMPGDKIIAINGEDAYKITKDEVFKKLRGRKGTKVDVTISRIGAQKPFDVTIIRDNIPIYSVGAATMIDENTGYIFLRRFSATTTIEVKSALEKLQSQGMTRLLFDLRGNIGGFLEQAAAVSDQFITSTDTLVYTIGKIKESNQVFSSNPKIGWDNFSLIVMINRGSASASEIVAGAVQDLDRGLIVGETSFGKGLVQRQLGLRDGSAIRVTIARYFTPSGRLIQRAFEDGNTRQYYSELYEKNREAIIDSLNELRPKYKTRNGRTVYGGGGITPDEYIPWKLTLQKSTQKLIGNPKRPLFNWGTMFASHNSDSLENYKDFRDSWKIDNDQYDKFLQYLNELEIEPDSTEWIIDAEYIKNIIKSEIAGAKSGKDAQWGVRLMTDNQINQTLNHFDQAEKFLIIN